MTERPALLVLRALGLGDLLTAVPAVRALADAFPGHRRVLAAPAPLSPLVQLTGTAFEVLDAEPLAPLPPTVEEPDVAVNLHGRGPWSHRALLRLAPRRLVAFANHDVPWEGPGWTAEEHDVTRWCRMLSESGIPADPSRLELDRPAVVVQEWTTGVTIVHPGAASPARRWPPERWAEVARSEDELGRTVAVTGTSGERELARAVARRAGLPDGAVLAGRTGLLGLAALVAAAGLVVSGDTGIGHLATAFGTPSVVLFGPTSPAHWGPPPDRRQHVPLWAGVTGDPHGATVDEGLMAIRIEDVLAAIERARYAVLLGGRR